MVLHVAFATSANSTTSACVFSWVTCGVLQIRYDARFIIALRFWESCCMQSEIMALAINVVMWLILFLSGFFNANFVRGANSPPPSDLKKLRNVAICGKRH